MEPAKKSSGKRAASPAASAGGLVVQTGKKAGTRRPLGKSLTCIGHASTCDIRLQGISPFHCLLIHGSEGLELRDLDSPPRTLVNGKRVSRTQFHDGASLRVGG